MSTHAEDSMEGEVSEARRPLPSGERESITYKAEIGSPAFEFYITAGKYDDGTLGEVFIRAGKDGSTIQGLLDAWAITFSIALQYGAEFPMLARKLAHMRFEPLGYTDDERIPQVASILDYTMRWLTLQFGDEKLQSDMRKIAEEMGLA
jgi:ribonucleoside-diphosphate reductase alpha chain